MPLFVQSKRTRVAIPDFLIKSDGDKLWEKRGEFQEC